MTRLNGKNLRDLLDYLDGEDAVWDEIRTKLESQLEEVGVEAGTLQGKIASTTYELGIMKLELAQLLGVKND